MKKSNLNTPVQFIAQLENIILDYTIEIRNCEVHAPTLKKQLEQRRQKVEKVKNEVTTLINLYNNDVL